MSVIESFGVSFIFTEKGSSSLSLRIETESVLDETVTDSSVPPSSLSGVS